MSRLRHTEKRITFVWLVLLMLFSGVITSGGFLLHGKLYWDTGRIFLQFRDQLHSLNVFGEPAYWFPQYQLGSPGFYHSILGIPSCLQPAFAVIGIFVWVLGRAGVVITQYQPLYVFYFGFLIPAIFLHSLYIFSRSLYPPSIQKIILIMGAFSPGVLFNLSDVGYLEPSAYGLYFLGFLLPLLLGRAALDKKTALTLLISATSLGLSLNHAFLYWNLFAIPLLICALLISFRTGLLHRISSLPKTLWLGMLFSFLIGFLPNVVTLKEGRDLVRSSLGDAKEYPLERLAPGNPLEMLTVSLPGFGFDWKTDRIHWALMPLSADYHTAYYYLGLLCLPMFFWGLLRGRRVVRNTILVFCVLFFAILSLSAYSPFFAMLLALPTPLRSCNHFSDAAFKAGSYLILIFGAAEGFHAYWERHRRTGFLWLLFATIAINLLVHFRFHGEGILGNYYVGMMLFLGVTLGTLFFQRRHLGVEKEMILFLCLLDVSTHSFLWVRNIWGSKLVMNSGWPAYHRIDETPRDDGLGLRIGWHSHFYANTLLLYRPYFEMLRRQINPYELPHLALFEKGHPPERLDEEFAHWMGTKERRQGTLPVDGGLSSSQATGEIKTVALAKERRTYNTWDFELISGLDGWLFMRDAFSPHWRAAVNGISRPISRAFFNFRAIPIKKGVQVVHLEYRPMLVRISLWTCYMWLASLGMFLVREFCLGFFRRNQWLTDLSPSR